MLIFALAQKVDREMSHPGGRMGSQQEDVIMKRHIRVNNLRFEGEHNEENKKDTQIYQRLNVF